MKPNEISVLKVDAKPKNETPGSFFVHKGGRLGEQSSAGPTEQELRTGLQLKPFLDQSF